MSDDAKDCEYNDLVLVFKPHKGFTRRVFDISRTRPDVSYRAYLDGPYGGLSRKLEAFETVLMVAGGSGITPIVAHLQHLASKIRQGEALTRDIRIIWTVKRFGMVLPCTKPRVDSLLIQFRISRMVQRWNLRCRQKPSKKHVTLPVLRNRGNSRWTSQGSRFRNPRMATKPHKPDLPPTPTRTPSSIRNFRGRERIPIPDDWEGYWLFLWRWITRVPVSRCSIHYPGSSHGRRGIIGVWKTTVEGWITVLVGDVWKEDLHLRYVLWLLCIWRIMINESSVWSALYEGWCCKCGCRHAIWYLGLRRTRGDLLAFRDLRVVGLFADFWPSLLSWAGITLLTSQPQHPVQKPSRTTTHTHRSFLLFGFYWVFSSARFNFAYPLLPPSLPPYLSEARNDGAGQASLYFFGGNPLDYGYTVVTLVALINGWTLLLVPHNKVAFRLAYCLEFFFFSVILFSYCFIWVLEHGIVGLVGVGYGFWIFRFRS